VLVNDGQQVRWLRCLTDGPIKPHELLECYFDDLRSRALDEGPGAISKLRVACAGSENVLQIQSGTTRWTSTSK